MSLFEDDRYCWRETYFVLFSPARRPTLSKVQKELAILFPRLRIRDSQANGDDFFEMLSVVSLEDKSGLDIVFQQGESIAAETTALIDELQRQTTTPKTLETLERIRNFDARLDLVHFEQTEPIDANGPDLPPTIIFPKYRMSVPPPEFISRQARSRNTPPVEKTESPTGPFATRKHFAFDPDNYIEPELPETLYCDDEPETLDGLNPNALVLSLELLVRLTDGVAIDPASGCLL